MSDHSTRHWFTTRQAAEFTGFHPDTVRKALEAGDLVGEKRHEKAHWRIQREALDAWQKGVAA